MANKTDPTVGLVGFRAMMRDLAKMGEEGSPLLDAMKQAGREAAEPVAGKARGTVPHVDGILAGDIRVTSARSGATIRMGRGSVPYAGPVEFGSWPPGRPFVAGGRYLFPAAQGMASILAASYSEAVNRILNGSGVWTNAGNDPEGIHD